MKFLDELKQSLMSMILENDLEPQFNKLFNKYKDKKNKDNNLFKLNYHFVSEEKVSLNKEFFSYILLDNTSIKKQVYEELIKLIYSDLNISRLTINLKNYQNSFSLLTLSLINNKLKLTEEQKLFIEKEALSSDTASHKNNGYDLRYFILRNKNWDVEEKVNLINKFYDKITIKEKLIEWKNAIDKRTIKKLNLEELFNLPYDDYYCLLKDTDTSEDVWLDVRACYTLYLCNHRHNELNVEEKSRILKKNNIEE